MREMIIAEEQLTLENGTDCLLSYYVVISEVSSDESLILENYGVKIVMRSVERGNECIDEAAAMNITGNAFKIFELACLLSKNNVTPMSLMDVVIDYI